LSAIHVSTSDSGYWCDKDGKRSTQGEIGWPPSSQEAQGFDTQPRAKREVSASLSSWAARAPPVPATAMLTHSVFEPPKTLKFPQSAVCAPAGESRPVSTVLILLPSVAAGDVQGFRWSTALLLYDVEVESAGT